MMADLFTPPPSGTAAYAPGALIRAVPLRVKATPMPAPMMTGKHWYWLAAMAITDYQASTEPHQSFVDMTGDHGLIRIAVAASIKWLDRYYAEAMFCPVLFRDETDMEALVG